MKNKKKDFIDDSFPFSFIDEQEKPLFHPNGDFYEHTGQTVRNEWRDKSKKQDI